MLRCIPFGFKKLLLSGVIAVLALVPGAAVLADDLTPAAPDTTTTSSLDSSSDSQLTTDNTQPADNSTDTDQPSGNDTTTSPTDTSNSPDIVPADTTPPADTTNPDDTQIQTATPDSSSNTNNSQVTDPSDTTVNSDNGTVVTNTVDSSAQSGNAAVANNGQAGNATTGDAQATATLLNLLQSNIDWGTGAAPETFTYNVYGDVQGDISIDPSQLAAIQTNNDSPAGNVVVQAGNGAAINNNVSLSAASGDATVANNGQAGNATTGDANTVADIVNIINSLAASNQSFVGTINIYGNLDGNILLPPGYLDSLLASNSQSGPAGNGVTDLNNNAQINNNLVLNATTGEATVANNNSAGNATSGNAATNVTILNLTNQQIVAQNDLLVFVNVLGKWYGLIMNAPAGTTAAELGGGVTQSSVPSSGASYLDAINNLSINNNLKLNSSSGNASVTGNGQAGDATSGNATASVNLANIMNSNFSLSGWLGILFINVFGTWNGNLAEATVPVPASSGTHHKPTLLSFNSIDASPKVVLAYFTNPASHSNKHHSGDPQVLAANTNAKPPQISNQGKGIGSYIYTGVAGLLALTLLGVSRRSGNR